ncbi:MAG: hypothetical protein EBU90_07765 [Proteobacteria bacterium]|nr:hypothetical protein [Pseudomonadota bacterium]NBP14095.1 hypothetical protein [bacterium]
MQEVKLKEITLNNYKSMRTWCREQFGQEAWWQSQLQNPKASARWFANSPTPKDLWEQENKGSAVFIFRDEKEATLFSLKWS